MNGKVYYNEIDKFAAAWLRELIRAGHLPDGDVDERSIKDVRPDDLKGYTQCHFFAGIGGWSLAARLAGWPDERELWTGSAPCQPFSVAGKGAGTADARHLWPEFFRLIAERKPAAVMGEQVAAAVGKHWLDGVFADLEGIGYACGAAVVPACAVDAPHRRDRLWFVAERSGAMDHGERTRLEGFAGHGDDAGGWPQPDRPIAAAGFGGDVGDRERVRIAQSQGRESDERGRIIDASQSGNVADCAMQVEGRRGVCRPGEGARADGERASSELAGCGESAWAAHDWIIGHDGKARRVEPCIPLLVDGLSPWVAGMRASGETASRQVALKGFGNAIVPQVAAQVIGAYLDTNP